jgi:isoquinoline 1-oxidoreductase beta subunit
MANEKNTLVDGDTPASAGRRSVLKAGGGLVIAFSWFGSSTALGFATGKPQPGDAAAARADGSPAFAPNAFIRIGTDGSIRLVMPEVEMGQGSYTGQATLLAEELCVDLDQVTLEHSPPNEALYGLEVQGGQVTGGSNTIRGTWVLLREAGAVARTMLIGAAAKRWGVPAAQCQVERGVVHHAATHRQLAYGQVATDASHQPVPDKPELLSAKSYRLIGKSLKRLDAPAKTNGSMTFGIDVRVPGMKVAAVEIAPTVGGRVRHVDDQRARAVHGVVDVVVLGDAVAVTAGDFWTARKGLNALAIQWDPGPHAALSSQAISAEMAGLSATGKGLVAKEVGAGAKEGSKRVEAVYTLPMLAHATMEPMNALVAVRKDGCEIWVGTQVPTRVVDVAAKITGLPADKITVHNQYIGGGFGRRLETDSVEQAVEIAKHVAYPVKLIWTREQDIARDFFRPPYHDHLVATLDAKGYPATWRHRSTSDSVLDRWSPADMGKDGLDSDCVDGAIEPPYALPNLKVEWVRQRLPKDLKIGWWRGVGASHNLFPVESFVDELAHAAGQDPVAYRRAMLDKNPRARAVLDLAASKFGWDSAPKGPRIGRGVALGVSMSTLICAMVEVEVTPQGEIRLRRATAAVDCGIVVNPDTIVAQVQGGLVFGWSAALYGEVTLKDGAVEQQNFNDYRVMRLNEVPKIDVYMVPSTELPTGIGEPPTAIAAPCLANAVFAATGIRVRDLPIARTSLAAGASALDQVVT